MVSKPALPALQRAAVRSSRQAGAGLSPMSARGTSGTIEANVHAPLPPARRLLLLGLAAAGLAGAGLVTAVLAEVEATVVAVTAGRPTEYSFTLSRASRLPLGAVIFKVANRGSVAHQFTVCATPVATARLSSCRGPATKMIRPGGSARLTVSFTRRGTYEYLSGVPGQAARGMKGLIGVGVALPPPAAAPRPTTPATTTTAPAPTTPPAPTTTAPAASGEAAAGAEVWAGAGCGGCHTIGEVRGNVGPDLNLTHPGPFASGQLTAKQLNDLAAFVNGVR
jgi:uncharacterized cupredoxin-like copper-binding protein